MSVIWSEEEAEIIEECIKRYHNVIIIKNLDPEAKETIVKALNKVWNSLHQLELSLDEIDGDLDEVQESKRTIERALMVLETKGLIHEETDL